MDLPPVNKDGIVDLLDPDLVDESLRHEQEVFENLPIEGVCYFRDRLMREAVGLLQQMLPEGRKDCSCAEIGGGEGYFARHFKEHFSEGNTYVCDLSLKHLARAPDDLVRIRCDARRPYLDRGSLDAAVLWVSLHHFGKKDMVSVLERAVETLAPGGLLLIFEPNAIFLPRRLVYGTPLKKLVYYDEEEKPVFMDELKYIVGGLGLETRFVTGHNPPYNWHFLKKLPGGWLFYPGVQLLYGTERLFMGGGDRWWKPDGPQWPLPLGLYALAVFKK